MRYGLIALATVSVFGVCISPATAEVCGYDQGGQYHCIEPEQPSGDDAQYAPPPPPYNNGGAYVPQQPPYYQAPAEPENPCPRNWTIQSGRCKPYRGY